MEAKSKGKWGARKEQSHEELNQLCTNFFEAFIVPTHWKYIGTRHVIDPETNTYTSVGKIYRDMNTSGIDMKEYRVFFITYTNKGGIVEKSYPDFGKHKYSCLISNKTADVLNEFIKQRYENSSND